MSHCRLNLKVVPGASATAIVGWLGDALKVKVTAPPEKGKANNAVENLMSEVLNISKGKARIVAGKTSTQKVLEVDGMTLSEVREFLSYQS